MTQVRFSPATDWEKEAGDYIRKRAEKEKRSITDTIKITIHEYVEYLRANGEPV